MYRYHAVERFQYFKNADVFAASPIAYSNYTIAEG